MKPIQIFNELMNLKTGSLSNAISSDDEYSKITLYASLLVHKNIQFSKVYLGDKLLGTVNKYRYNKLDAQVEVDNDEDKIDDVSNLFSSMLTSYLNTVRVNDTLIKTIIIFLVSNNYITEFRNTRKLSESEWGIRIIEFLNNASISTKVITSTVTELFKNYPIHLSIIKDRVNELMTTLHFRDRYLQLMSEAWSKGELSADDPIELELLESVLNLRNTVRSTNLNINVKDLCPLLEIGESTYRNKKKELVNNLSKYYFNSIYSSMIDLVNSMK